MTKWSWTLEIEAKRVLHEAHEIANGFFKRENFVVLPHRADVKSTGAVLFPDLPFITIPRFWQRVKKLDRSDIPIKAPADLVERVKSLLENAQFSEPNVEKAKRLWAKAEKEMIPEIYKLIPDKAGKITQITIFPTLFGTQVSFNGAKAYPSPIYIHLREDQGVRAITEAILTVLTRRELRENFDSSWRETELLVDWLIAKSSLAKILAKYETTGSYLPTMKQARVKQHAKLVRQSNEFYRKLGVPATDNLFRADEGVIYTGQDKIVGLSKREEDVLKLLISQSNRVVSVDNLAAVMFKNEEDFSLYAISKTIQRTRDKLEKNGLSASFIQAFRGEGYLLRN